MQEVNLLLHIARVGMSGYTINSVPGPSTCFDIVLGIEDNVAAQVQFGNEPVNLSPTTQRRIYLPKFTATRVTRFFKRCYTGAKPASDYDCHALTYYATERLTHSIRSMLRKRDLNPALYQGPHANLTKGQVYRIIRPNGAIVHSFIGVDTNTALAVIRPGYPMVLSTQQEQESFYSGRSYLYIG